MNAESHPSPTQEDLAIPTPVKTILIDDEPEIVDILSMVAEGFSELKLFQTSDPREALRIIRREEIRLAISDINMPDLNGTQLMQECQNLPWNIDFIILSAMPDLMEARKCFELGALRTLIKPPDFNQLEDAVRLSLMRVREWNSIVKKFT